MLHDDHRSFPQTLYARSCAVILPDAQYRCPLLTPLPDHEKRHMLDVVIPKKDTLQVVDDDVDGPVGCVPDIRVVCPARRDKTHFIMKLKKGEL